MIAAQVVWVYHALIRKQSFPLGTGTLYERITQELFPKESMDNAEVPIKQPVPENSFTNSHPDLIPELVGAYAGGKFTCKDIVTTIQIAQEQGFTLPAIRPDTIPVLYVAGGKPQTQD